VFCGPNGSGKTTLLRSLAGAYRAAAHTLRAGRTVYVSEHPPIFPGSLIQNVTMFTEDVDWHRVDVIAGEIGLSEIVAQFPSGWDTFMDPAAVGRLSAGQTKRLALARAMYSQREIWLLDEPFDSLDDAHSRLFSAAIARARSTHIIVIATHDNLKWLPPDSRICQFESDVTGGGFVVREIEHPGATLRAV
jgi:ABC-type transport system involved in cytochrome bd biosynthesis fused ATPase/permease subunit